MKWYALFELHLTGQKTNLFIRLHHVYQYLPSSASRMFPKHLTMNNYITLIRSKQTIQEVPRVTSCHFVFAMFSKSFAHVSKTPSLEYDKPNKPLI